MTDRELMQQALDALNRVMRHGSAVQEAKDILRAALRDGIEQQIIKNYLEKDNSQPLRTHWEGCEEVHPECRKPEQEPVAWMDRHGACMSAVFKEIDAIGDEYTTPLYTTPPQRREWVGLTADEIWKCNAAPKGSAVEYHICMAHQNVLDFAEAIEAKLKEKNA